MRGNKHLFKINKNNYSGFLSPSLTFVDHACCGEQLIAPAWPWAGCSLSLSVGEVSGSNKMRLSLLLQVMAWCCSRATSLLTWAACLARD